MSPKSARVSDVSRYEPMFLAYSEMLSTICAGGFKPKPRNKFAVWESDSLVDCSCRPQSVERSSTVFSINPRSAETPCVCMQLPYPAAEATKDALLLREQPPFGRNRLRRRRPTQRYRDSQPRRAPRKTC